MIAKFILKKRNPKMTRLIALVSLVMLAGTACADWNWKDNGGTVYQQKSKWAIGRESLKISSGLTIPDFSNYNFSYGDNPDIVMKVHYGQKPWQFESVSIRQDYIKSIRFEDGKMIVEIKEPENEKH